MLESENDKSKWQGLSEDSSVGSMYQSFWWADPLKRHGVRAKGIGMWKENRLVGGGLFRSIPIPFVGSHLTQCLAGPLHLDWEPRWADEFVSQVAQLARDDNSMEVAIHRCPSREMHRDIIDAFLRRGLKITFASSAAEAVLSLKDSTPEDIWKGMIKGTRENIRKAQKNAIQIRELTSSDELRSAHTAWMATAKRKNFTDIRPWASLEPVLRYCVDNDIGKVYASFKDDKMLAAIFIVFIGGQALYVYGGFMDGSEKHSPNHILHFEAIKHCFERRIETYNFGDLTWNYEVERGGTDQFKFGFGARPKQNLDSIIWKRKPLLAGCCAWLQRNQVGKKLVAELRRHMAERG